MGGNLDPNISQHCPYRIWSNLCIHGCRNRSSRQWSSPSFQKCLLGFNSPLYFMLTFFPSALFFCEKYFRWFTCTFCLFENWSSRQARSLSEHQPRACHQHDRLVVRETACFSTSPSHGTRLSDYSGWVVYLYFMFFLINNHYLY